MMDLPENGPKWQLGRRFFPILVTVAIGLNVAVSSWFAVSAWEERLAKADFINVASDYAAVLQNGLDQYLSKLVAVRAFYDASVKVDPDEFDLFTSRLLRGQAALMRVTWSPRVTGDDRAVFEAKARAEGIAGFAIKTWAARGTLSPAPPQAEYFPVLYSTRLSKSVSALGVDLTSEPMRSQAIERARDGDRMATAPDVIIRGTDGERGFFVTLPVYRRGMSQISADDRRRNTLGVLSGTFRTATVIDAILATKQLPRNVDLYLYPVDAGPDATPDLSRTLTQQDASIAAKPLAETTRALNLSTVLKAGDASWKLVVTPAEGRLTGFYRAWLVLLFVALAFGAVLAYMWASVRNALRLEQVQAGGGACAHGPADEPC